MTIPLLLLAALPAVVSGHGSVLPITENPIEARIAAASSVKLIGKAVGECEAEATHCLETEGLIGKARCLIQAVDDLSSGCHDKMVEVIQHIPLAVWSMLPEEKTPQLGSEDFGNRTVHGCNVSKDQIPYVWSYHLHLQWDFPDNGGYETMLNFTKKFIAEFQPDIKMCRPLAYLTDLWNKESVSPEHIDDHPYADTCEMATVTPGGPFLHAEKGFTLSVEMFHRVLPWLMANRPLNDKLYIFVHPNTGCQYNDLRHWSMWSSKSVRMFFDILLGCQWVACEDEVLGCIAFNHLGKNQGYGTCYKAPKEVNADCKMSIEPTSNTSTMRCTKTPVTTVV
jgi:hypothetical protein